MRPKCNRCGEQAPYGDERFSWLGWHEGLIHRIVWEVTKATQRGEDFLGQKE